MNMGNQSQKDKHLPPCATATYQPIKAMNNDKYNKRYMMAIMVNPPASTPPPNYQPHPPNHRPLRPAPALCLPSHTIWLSTHVVTFNVDTIVK
ncbi:hypothetical protein DSO57_1002984 [Entomophthora muscae]|uniref:Uncharacterized protein n=1 Tax=Entomophthora muscae TaxID=34485 RepID=A0ACC2U6T0_9FUNG|nr:hypothetical protein DSO57_1002984 [Entomophthora muscae]